MTNPKRPGSSGSNFKRIDDPSVDSTDDPGRGPRRAPRNSMDELSDQMASEAAEAFRGAADALSRGIGAGAVGLGLRLAGPLSDWAEGLGDGVADLINGVGGPGATTEEAPAQPTRHRRLVCTSCGRHSTPRLAFYETDEGAVCAFCLPEEV